jgi:hypothetical protein
MYGSEGQIDTKRTYHKMISGISSAQTVKKRIEKDILEMQDT